KTYLQENFKSKQIAFLKVWCNRKGFDSKYIHQIRFKINGWKLKVEDPRTPEMDRLISLHRKILGIENNEMFISKRGWMTHNYSKIVVYFSILSKFLKRNGKREILLAPLPKIKTAFLFIDSSVFKGILSSIKYTNRKQKYDKSMYNDVFNFNKLLTQRQVQDGFVFTNTIQTDGVAINFHFRRPNLVISEPKTLDRTDPTIRVIAQDPGRVTLFCGVEELDNGKYRKYKLSRNSFYTDTGIRKAVKKTNKWNIESPELRATLDQLSQTSSRSNRLHEFFEYVKIVKNNEDILWNEYTKQRYARQRFALYSGKKSVYDKFFHSIVADDPTKKVVIAFGDAGFA